MNAHRQQNGVITTWTFSNPTNVSRYVIQRSYDGFFFENIGEVTGGAAGRQEFKEDNVFPGYLHYKVIAIMNDGSTVHSSIQMVRVVRNG